MLGRDLSLLLEASMQAGEIARKYWRNDPDTWDKGDGAGPVTVADLEVDTFLRETLCAARPDYAWLSEETEDSAERLDAERVFIVDPIDGTRAFVAGQRTFAHSLAIAENGKVTDGVVYLPLRDKLYAAEAGGGATFNGQPVRVTEPDGLVGATVLAARPNFEPKHWHGGTPPMERHFRSSLAYRLSLVGEGRFDAMMTLRDSWEWDIAAGAIIAQEAGATVTDRRGEPLQFNSAVAKTKGVIVAGGALHRDLSARLAR